MLTTIVEFSFASIFALYIADAAAAIHDSHKARKRQARKPRIDVIASLPEMELPDVCIPDEAIAAPAPEVPQVQEPEVQEPEVLQTQEPEVPATPAPKAKRTRAASKPKTPSSTVKSSKPKAAKPKSPSIAELKALCKSHGIKGVSALSKGDLILKLRSHGVEVL